jgi:hypothetical protein
VIERLPKFSKSEHEVDSYVMDLPDGAKNMPTCPCKDDKQGCITDELLNYSTLAEKEPLHTLYQYFPSNS